MKLCWRSSRDARRSLGGIPFKGNASDGETNSDGANFTIDYSAAGDEISYQERLYNSSGSESGTGTAIRTGSPSAETAVGITVVTAITADTVCLAILSIYC